MEAVSGGNKMGKMRIYDLKSNRTFVCTSMATPTVHTVRSCCGGYGCLWRGFFWWRLAPRPTLHDPTPSTHWEWTGRKEWRLVLKSKHCSGSAKGVGMNGNMGDGGSHHRLLRPLRSWVLPKKITETATTTKSNCIHCGQQATQNDKISTATEFITDCNPLTFSFFSDMGFEIWGNNYSCSISVKKWAEHFLPRPSGSTPI